MIKVLVIDDDHQLAGLIKAYFISLSISVEIDYNPMSALRHLKTNKYDLLLTDVNMTPMSGFQLITEVRSFNKKMKIIAMSGSFSNEYNRLPRIVRDLEKIGVDKFLAKPFSVNDLKEPLEELDLIS